MSTVLAAHSGPWTERDLVDLPDDGQRYELLEGALVVNPPPSGAHQLVSLELVVHLRSACPPGLQVVEALGIRLPDGSMFVPDVLVADRTAVLDAGTGVLDASTVRLAAEIVSPGSRTNDRVTKPAVYARAGIRSYWRVELDEGSAVHAYLLEDGVYQQASLARPGERLQVAEPFSLGFDPITLRP